MDGNERLPDGNLSFPCLARGLRFDVAVKTTLNDPEVDRVCTRRLLSHKLQIARYYRAAFFSVRYTRL